jgi:hypothetical protein
MKKAIYTAIFGNYDILGEPQKITPGWDYICFTDNKDLIVPIDCDEKKKKTFGKSKHWDVRYFEPIYDPSWNARYVKINYHKLLPSYDLVIWIDGLITFMKHPERDCIYEEFKAILTASIIKLNSLGFRRVIKQINYYLEQNYPYKNGLAGTGVNVRNKSDEIAQLMDIWWNLVYNYSNRDQLSFNYALWDYNREREDKIDVNYIPYWKTLVEDFGFVNHGNKKIIGR